MDHNHKAITNGSFRYGQNHIVIFTEETLNGKLHFEGNETG